MLAKHALPILMGWQRTGEIVGLCSREGRGFGLTDVERLVLSSDKSTRISLADDTITRALRTFTRIGLRDGHWDPERGRSLRSYFVTTCVREYPAVFRHWRSERKHQLLPDTEIATDTDIDTAARTVGHNLPPPTHPGPDDTVVQRSVDDALLHSVPPTRSGRSPS